MNCDVLEWNNPCQRLILQLQGSVIDTNDQTREYEKLVKLVDYSGDAHLSRQIFHITRWLEIVHLMQIDDRISVSGNIGNVRYIGDLEGTGLTWIGVEWDDAARGKHSGTYKGRSVFPCRPGSGSFLKESKIKLDATYTFTEAVRLKYIDESPNQREESTLVSGISKPVQSIGFDKIKERHRDLSNATDIFVASASIDRIDLDELKVLTLPNLEVLDLSWNLLSDISSIIALCDHFPALRSLKLEGNRFSRIPKGLRTKTSVEELILNLTLLSWDDVAQVASMFGTVGILHLALNKLETPTDMLQPDVRELNLHGNTVTNLHAVLTCFPALRSLNLCNNGITCIRPNADDSDSQLQLLNLAGNPLGNVSDLRNLRCYRNLRELQYTLTYNDKVDEETRLIIIQALPQLDKINKTTVTLQEREDAAHFGRPKVNTIHTMSDNIISLSLVHKDIKIEKKLLNNQTVKQLRTIYARLAKTRPTKIVTLTYRFEGVETQLTDDLAHLSYYGIQDGGEIFGTIEY